MSFKLKLLAVILLIFSSMVLTANATTGNITNANNAFTPPKPLVNKVFDGMVGSWSGTSDMMGTRMSQTLRVRWSLNHQFLIMELDAKAIDDPKIKYQGLGVFGIDSKGKVKTWWFDSWGASAMSTGTGDIGENKVTVIDGNAMFHETRSFELQGNQMIMRAKGTMNFQGKQMPFDTTTIYRK